jgi:hypothetical protein
MDFVRWMVQDMLSDWITWVAIIGILASWTWGVIDILVYGKEEAEE